MSVQAIIDQIKTYHSKADISLVERAYKLAVKAHNGQKRLSGEDYISHPIEVAKTLAELKSDIPTICAGLLHDVPEDTNIPLSSIKKNFGNEIAFLVNGVSKLGKIKYRGEKRYIENLRKLFLSMCYDIRVVLVKLADRLHNMKTLSYLPKDKQYRIALETLEIYAPIADRLGIGTIKGRLEDLAFPYVYPKEYKWLINNVKEKYEDRENYINFIIPKIKQYLESEKVKILDIHGRAKHYFSLYKKLEKYEMNWDKIYDLIAIRIIVNDISDCYKTLGLIHKNWKPLLGRIKDYIALPKPNGYRSLHTTVFCINGKITEFQIRTPQMHKEAEYGIAAHWAYTEAGKLSKDVYRNNNQLPWIKQLQKWQKEIKNSREFIKYLKIDFFKDRIFVFTPKGDVIDLPEEATPIDFAYHIHTDIGHKCAGAKVDGKLCSLSQSLKNGQVVEIITKKEKKPNPDWLRFAKTNYAKNRIKNWLRKNKN